MRLSELQHKDVVNLNDGKKIGNIIDVSIDNSGKKVGYIAYNTRKEWKNGHTHLDSFDMAKTIISNVINHKKPKTKNLYLMRSHSRLSDDIEYIRLIDELIDAKKNKGKTQVQ